MNNPEILTQKQIGINNKKKIRRKEKNEKMEEKNCNTNTIQCNEIEKI